jgi:hypothetical protein
MFCVGIYRGASWITKFRKIWPNCSTNPLVGIAIPDSALDRLEEELLRIAKENRESPQRFSDAVTEILKVPHTEIKLRLDEERNVKKKWKKAKKSSAPREGA